MDDTAITLGYNLTLLRKQKGKTQAEVADELNLGERVLSYYEHGKRGLDNELLVKFSEYFGVSTDELLKENLDTEEYKSRIIRLQNKYLKNDLPNLIKQSDLWKKYQTQSKETENLLKEHAEDDEWLSDYYFNKHEDLFDQVEEANQNMMEGDYDVAQEKLEKLMIDGNYSVFESLLHSVIINCEIEKNSVCLDELSALEDSLEFTEKILAYGAIAHNALVKDLEAMGILDREEP